MKTHLTDFQLDLLTVIMRLQQLEEVGAESALGEFLINRLITCDLPRVKKYLDPDTIAWAEQVTGQPFLKVAVRMFGTDMRPGWISGGLYLPGRSGAYDSGAGKGPGKLFTRALRSR